MEAVATATSIIAAMPHRRNRCRVQGAPITSVIGDLGGAGQGRTAHRIVWPAFGHTARASVPWTWRPHLMMEANNIRSWRGCTVKTECLLRTKVRSNIKGSDGRVKHCTVWMDGCLFGLLIAGFAQCRLNLFSIFVCRGPLQQLVPKREHVQLPDCDYHNASVSTHGNL